MNTPIIDFVREYLTRGSTRLHMPGHKGIKHLGPEAHDITEIDGADVLYSPTGIIRESEENAAILFGTARTVYSAEGSSLSIKAMMMLLSVYAKERGERPRVLAARNAHKSFVNAAALIDFDIKWMYSDSLMSSSVTKEHLKKALLEYKPHAVYITSPDYLGNIADIGMIAELAHEHGALLFVDNAHGAYLKFLPNDMHPITLGADIVCDSAHKTLPVLTGGGYLHLSKNAPSVFCERVDEAMALFASTSPSYLILQSLDLANAYIADSYRERLRDFSHSSARAKGKILESGIGLAGSEPLKITLKTKEYGYTGTDFAKILEKFGYTVEFYDEDFVTMMLSVDFSPDELDKLTEVIISVKRKAPIKKDAPPPPITRSAMSVREAMLAPSELLPTSECEGRILSVATVSCPPAVPIVVSGEIITKEAIEALNYYGTHTVRVVK